MINHNVSNSELIGLLNQWLDPNKSSVILCRNVVDIMRLRIQFHEELSFEKNTFLNVHFLTIDQWLKKIMPGLENSNQILSHPLSLKIYLRSLIEELKTTIQNPLLLNLLELPGFKNEIPILWHIYTWSKCLGISAFQYRQTDILAEALLDLFSKIDAFLKSSALNIVPNLLNFKTKVWIPEDHYPDHVICLYPSRFSPIELIKMDFLVNLHKCPWKCVVNSDMPVTSPGTIPEMLNNRENFHEIYITPATKVEEILYDDWKRQNQNFFLIDSIRKEKKIWMGRTAADEYYLLACSVKTLFDSGIEPNKIFILYGAKNDISLMEYAFRKVGLKLNHPEKTNASTRPIFALAMDLMDLLSLRKESGYFTRNRLIDFFQNPLLKIHENEDLESVIPGILEYIYEKFDLNERISLHQIKAIQLGTDRQWTALAKLADNLHADLENLSAQNLARKKFLHFKNILEKYVDPDAITNSAYKDQWTEIEKIFSNFYDIEIKLKKNLGSDFLFNIFYEELANVKLSGNNHPQLQMEFPEVYARSIREGIHSPVDYLFICGLTSQNFPRTEDHITYLFPDKEPGQSLLELSANEQILKITESFNLVKHGIALTFNLEKDSAPSDLIFHQVGSIGNNAFTKKEMISDIPVYLRNHTEEIIHGLNGTPSLDTYQNLPDSILSFEAKISSIGSSNYRSYTGQSLPAKENLISSAGLLENIAGCPQMFWFKKVLGLKKSADVNEPRFVDTRTKGSLFHLFARFLIDYLIRQYHSLTYSGIRKALGEKKLDIILHDAFLKTEEEFFRYYKIENETLNREILINFGAEFILYFKKFFYVAELGEHPFGSYYPLAVELPFENITFASLIFKGRIDRIDYSPSQKIVSVVDYKTATSTNYGCNAKEVKNLSRFQLPLYVLALLETFKSEKLPALPEIAFIQGSYEMVRNSGKFPEIFFMELDAGRIQYNLDEINSKLEQLVEPGFNVLKEILQSGYFFAVGHKKNHHPDEPWEPPCSYCDYRKICDNMPFDIMLKRIQNDTLGKKYFDAIFGDANSEN